MDKTKLSMEVSSTSGTPDISLKIFLDQTEIFSGTAADLPATINHEFDDVEADKHLKIMMSGKTAEHTTIDADGNILQDIVIEVKEVEFDGINIDKLIWNLAEYQHDFNGTQLSSINKFFGIMGCNGTVELKFTSPVYLWLLENM